jgi:thiol:disulfide interchange protein DsbD
MGCSVFIGISFTFMLFAMFPGWLNSLPKSGGWLNTVKVVLGFLELALAFKILVKCGLSATIAFAGRSVFWLFGLQFLEH